MKPLLQAKLTHCLLAATQCVAGCASSSPSVSYCPIEYNYLCMLAGRTGNAAHVQRLQQRSGQVQPDYSSKAIVTHQLSGSGDAQPKQAATVCLCTLCTGQCCGWRCILLGPWLSAIVTDLKHPPLVRQCVRSLLLVVTVHHCYSAPASSEHHRTLL